MEMEKDLQIYEALAEHLDRLPAGFPRTPTGVEMRILKRLFAPEEAMLARCLAMKPESAADIAARAGAAAEDVLPRLEEMSRKGLIFRVRKGPRTYFMAAQFVIGIWEYHVNDLDEDLIRDVNEYLPYFIQEGYRVNIPQLRTIPVSRSVQAEQAVMPYEEAKRIVSEQNKIVVAPCICRKEHAIMGEGCDRPLETCFVFGTGAAYYEENGLGRPVDKEEALRLLQAAEDAGLVLQPSNARQAVNICTCCGCCCQILKNLKKLPNPARYVASNYYAVVDAPACTGCGICPDRCWMDAITMEGNVASVNRDRCIGCGLCTAACPDNAVRLHGKPEGERREPPRYLWETFMNIAEERVARLKALKEE